MSKERDIFTKAARLSIYESDEIKPNPEMSKKALPGFKDTLNARRSIRVFDGVRIPEATMQDILEDATKAPSSSNLQPYQHYWIKSEDKKTRIAEFCMGQPAATSAGELVVVVTRGDLWKQNRDKLLDIMTEGGTKRVPKSVKHYYLNLIPKVMTTDPFGIFNLARRVGLNLAALKQPMVRTPVNKGDHRIWAHTQAALSAQTLMLSFSAHGYDSCPMGGMDAKRIHRELRLPRGAEIAMVIGAGVRKPEGLYGPRYRLATTDLIKEV